MRVQRIDIRCMQKKPVESRQTIGLDNQRGTPDTTNKDDLTTRSEIWVWFGRRRCISKTALMQHQKPAVKKYGNHPYSTCRDLGHGAGILSHNH